MQGRAAEDVFSDYKGRRAGIIKALTTDVHKFFRECDPANENLCLYGLPNGSWELNLPVDEVPPELPEPALGINFARDGMPEQNWVYLVAVHSDSWLMAVAFYFGVRFSFDKNERMRLFQMINDLPTIYEVVSGNAKEPKDQSAKHISSKSKSSGVKARQAESQIKPSKVRPPPPPREESESGDDDDEEEEEAEFCGECGEKDGEEEFWICCDTCERWFHGKCVKMTPAKAQHIKHYKCPSCCRTNKKHRA